MSNPYAILLAQTWRYASGHRLRLVGISLMFVAANLFVMLEPLVFGMVLNTLQKGGEGLFIRVAQLLGLYCSLTFGFWLFHGTARVMERSISFHVYKNFSERLFGILTRLPMRWHRSHHTGESLDRVRRSAGALRSFSDESYVYIETTVRFLASMVAIVAIMPLYGGIAFAAGSVITFIIFRFNKALIASLRDMIGREQAVAAVLQDYVRNIMTVLSLRLTKVAQNDVARSILDVFPAFRRNILINETKWFSVSIMLSLMNFALILLYIRQMLVIEGVVLVGSLLTLHQYVGRFIDVFFRVSGQYEKLMNAATNLQSSDPLFEAENSFAMTSEEAPLPPSWNQISIRDLSFHHDTASGRAARLENIDMDLPRGARIALVGGSGSGKSTLLSLLRGLEETDHASVTVDGESHSSLAAVCASSTLIPQDPEIFDRSIEFNILLGASVSGDELLQACTASCFDTVIETLPQGFATPIREDGANLSGGQKQRLALARGIIAARESSILLLDEPTSSLDIATEITVYQNIFALAGDRCIVSSIHRLNLLHMFDAVYVLEAGRIAESGSFYELLNRGGVLKQMWDRYQECLQPVESPIRMPVFAKVQA